MKRCLFTILFCLCVFALGFSQGCSDAGFCTMGAMKPNQRLSARNVRLRSIEFTEYFAHQEDLQVKFLNHILDVNFGVGDKTTLQAKFTYAQVFGVLANTNGLGDVSLSASRMLAHREHWQLNTTLGAKLPTNAANKSVEGRPLPMYYQTSLGTVDAVAGLSFVTKYLLLATVIQHPFNEVNNSFTWAAWKTDDKTLDANHYPISNGLIRGTDVMFRAEANMGYHRFNMSLGFLLINRLKKDQIVSPTTKQRVDVAGSDGNANTVLGGLSYQLNAKSNLKLVWGHRVAKRATNPDGLSRDNVWTVTYQCRF
jgi:hypothetical protein